MKVIVIDNYDSFTYNIVHYVERFVEQCSVRLVDEVDLEEIENYDKIILSPGPGLPSEKQMLQAVIERFHKSKPILGICLGHQALACFFGAELFNLSEVHHGLSRSTSLHKKDYLWTALPHSLLTGRYHSWAVCSESLPNCLETTACDQTDGTIMAFRHKTLDLRGVQFHPESVLTQNGLKMIENWIKGDKPPL